MKMQNSPFKMISLLGLSFIGIGALSGAAFAAPLSLQAGTYTETFNGFVGGNNPVPGWGAYQAATATGLGTAYPTSAVARDWSHTGGAPKNVSSTNIASTSTSAEQAANPDRAFGLNQVNLFGDPGVSINFNFSTAGLNVQSLSFDLLMLGLAPNRSTTFDIQYGIGASPTSFSNLGIWSDPGVWGATAYTFDRDDFGSALDGQSSVWFRFAALIPSAGSGGVRDQVAIDNFSLTSTSAVPEPSTYALMSLGAMAALMMFVRRRSAA